MFIHTYIFILCIYMHAYNAGDLGSIPGLGISPGEGNDYPLQCSCMENPMDRGTWWATIPEVTKSWTQLNNIFI